jgi:hypothetical protein
MDSWREACITVLINLRQLDLHRDGYWMGPATQDGTTGVEFFGHRYWKTPADRDSYLHEVKQASTDLFQAIADADVPFPHALRALDRELMGELFNAIRDETPEDDPQHLGFLRMANRLYALAHEGALPDGWVQVILPRSVDAATATVADWHEAIKTLARDVRRAETKRLRTEAIPSNVRQTLAKPVADPRHRIRGGSGMPARVVVEIEMPILMVPPPRIPKRPSQDPRALQDLFYASSAPWPPVVKTTAVTEAGFNE